MKKYLVGGAVRDELLNIPVKERDWVIIGATPEQMIKMGYQQVGKDFPVFLHPKTFEEYALARTERKIGYGHTDFLYCSSSRITLEEDLYRRDLTINAIARDEKGKLIDPYSGQKDIHNRYLRHVSSAFNEDPLRVLRVARFAARFAHLKFKVFPKTLDRMKNMISELSFLSSERIWKETEQALLTKNPQVYFKVLRECGALKVIFPEIDSAFDDQLNTIYITKMLSIVSSVSEDIEVRFAILCCSFKKIFFSSEIYNRSQGIKLIETFCKNLKVPKNLCKFAKFVIKNKDILHRVKSLTTVEIVNFLNEINVWNNPSKLEKLIISSKIDFLVKKNLLNNRYVPGKFLKKVYQIANSINIKKILSKNYSGIAIKKALYLARLNKIESWNKVNH